jgi:hypothetical protein
MNFFEMVIEGNCAVPLTLSNTHQRKTIPNVHHCFSLLEGWQLMEIACPLAGTAEIKDILMHGHSIGEDLYTSWFEHADGRIQQPATWLGDQQGLWRMMMHSDPAVFKERCCSNIHPGDSGKNLFQDYLIYADLGMEIKRLTPRLRSFFGRPEGINWHPNDDLARVPFVPLALDIPDLLSELEALALKPHANPRHRGWFHAMYYPSDLPSQRLDDWLCGLGLVWSRVNVSRLDPGGYIEMHRDTDATSSLHINLSRDGGGLVKVANGGVMPQGANIINNHYHVHAAVNDSDLARYALIVKADLSDEWIRSRMKQGVLGLDAIT